MTWALIETDKQVIYADLSQEELTSLAGDTSIQIIQGRVKITYELIDGRKTELSSWIDPKNIEETKHVIFQLLTWQREIPGLIYYITEIESNEFTPTIPTDPIPSFKSVQITPGIFNLSQDRLTGSIVFVATSEFNPFYHGKNLLTVIKVRDKTGILLHEHTNNLFFSATERDETIDYDFDAFGNTELEIDVFVFYNSLSFTQTYQANILESAAPGVPPPGKAGDNTWGDILKGLTVGTIATLFLNRGARPG